LKKNAEQPAQLLHRDLMQEAQPEDEQLQPATASSED
jgi:hypothetical protein